MKFANSFAKKIKQIGLGALLVGVMSISLAACGGDTASPGAPAATNPTATTAAGAATGGGTMKESTVALSEWAITPKDIELPAGKTKFVVSNDGKFSHNLVLMEGTNEAGRTPNFAKGDGPKSVEVDLKPGTYKMLCDILGHADKGMMGTLTVK